MHSHTFFARARRVLLAGVAALFVTGPSFAQDQGPSAALEYISKAARTSGWTEAELMEILGQAQFQPRILELMEKPAERAMPWYVYEARIVDKERIAAGKEFMATHAKALARAQATSGVPKEIIAGIIGLETRYGTNRGSYRVLDSLATLSFHYPRRAAFFQKELTAFLTLARAGDVDLMSLKGSYAGAYGWPQFMPSNVAKLATDFDGDGKIDLYNSPTDAIGSVANYLKENGWKPGKTVVSKRKGSAGSNLELEGEDGPLYFKTEHNFKVIRRYNQSNLYAMAVYKLSQKLK